MKISWQLAASLFVLTAAIEPCATAAQQGDRPSPAKPQPAVPSGKTGEADSRADAYYYFTLGHYYQQEYEASNHAEDANRAIDFYKKAYALIPTASRSAKSWPKFIFSPSASATPSWKRKRSSPRIRTIYPPGGCWPESMSARWAI